MKTTKFFFCILAFFVLAVNVCQSQTLTPDFAVNFIAGSNDEIQKSIVDEDGNMYIAGIYYSESLTFGNYTLLKKGSNDIFLVKLDSNANVIFATSFLNTGSAKVTGLSVDALGSIYISGYYNDHLEFDSIALQCVAEPNSPSGSNNSFVTKINCNGGTSWAKSYAGDSQAGSLVIDSEQNVFISGVYYGTMTINNIQTTIQS